ncbi:MAG: dihydropteroate synthase [Armatimonadetes bacterium]|nr:dihydropteroate synthase [Armatimonadota bacterium]
MIVIGERINGMFKRIGEAIATRDEAPIIEAAQAQVEKGANYLDLNVGPASDEPVAAMQWLVETVRKATDTPLSIDSPKPDVIRAGLDIAGSNSIINSTTGEAQRLAALMPLAAEYGCPIIGLTIDENGVPRDAPGRTEVALKIVASAMEHGVPPDNVWIDPVILPISCTQNHQPEVLKAIAECKLLSDPSPKTVLGLSNVSQGTRYRSLVNRTYLVMAIAYGLDAAIMDPLDDDLMDAMITAELLMNKTVYCDDFLKAYRT